MLKNKPRVFSKHIPDLTTLDCKLQNDFSWKIVFICLMNFLPENWIPKETKRPVK